MHYRYLHLILCVSLLYGCSESCQSISFKKWNMVDGAVLRLPQGEGSRTITDPNVIQQIRTFAQARTDRWEVPFPDTPIPIIVINLNRAGSGIDHLGIGPDFIETSGSDYVVSRKITPAEQRELLKILSLPENAFKTLQSDSTRPGEIMRENAARRAREDCVAHALGDGQCRYTIAIDRAHLDSVRARIDALRRNQKPTCATWIDGPVRVTVWIIRSVN